MDDQHGNYLRAMVTSNDSILRQVAEELGLCDVGGDRSALVSS